MSIEQRVTEILDEYSDGDEDFEGCEPEDRWRLYRDLRAVVAASSGPETA